MATLNPFDLLDDDAEDPSLLIAAEQQKQVPPPASVPKKGPAQQFKPAAKLPSKPLPPSEAVREARNDGQRGGGRGGPRGGFGGRGRGRGFNQYPADGENTFGSSNGFSGGYKASEDGDSAKHSERRVGYGGPRGEFRGGRRGGFSNGDTADERPRRAFERRSGTGRGNEFKREGAGRGNWGTPADEFAPEKEEPLNEGEKIVDTEKPAVQADAEDASKDSPAAEPQEKEPEEKEMTLEEYEKLLEDKRKALLALKPEERKVNLDKELESMQLLSNKKSDDEVFIKLGSEKDKRKEAVEKAKKTKSINEFLKPADGGSYYRRGGRGRGGRDHGRDGVVGNNSVSAPSIEDVRQFPSLGAK
ncbi:RGG repeats nuclear RNA binding protein A isoform X1 [Nicotiana tomentosiformis]|uniref:RGG repeats nuclear RNA binding protein A isoform X1 n=1 Tax=Nicotiana tomentosiformis TaxID=4098 RepID=UPI00051C812E|nr:RGG repeats nuclear RNA binding protein A isoform X1 [Nicotiana tomentosiformis]XP_016451599.1 PREDICTED: intracellular hyaluronan-binding protein 4-like isoform X1 [Nicotiana tabacum]